MLSLELTLALALPTSLLLALAACQLCRILRERVKVSAYLSVCVCVCLPACLSACVCVCALSSLILALALATSLSLALVSCVLRNCPIALSIRLCAIELSIVIDSSQTETCCMATTGICVACLAQTCLLWLPLPLSLSLLLPPDWNSYWNFNMGAQEETRPFNLAKRQRYTHTHILTLTQRIQI